MRIFEFILVLVLIIAICVMAFFTRWKTVADSKSESEPKKPKVVAEAVPDYSQSMYLELPVSRMDFVVLLGRKLGLEQAYGSVNFTDIPRDSTGLRYIYPMVKAGLISGYPDNTFRPNDFISTNEAEIIVARALKRPIPSWYDKSSYLTVKQMSELLSGVKEEEKW